MPINVQPMVSHLPLHSFSTYIQWTMDQSKCEFMLPSVKFLAYRVDGEGQHPKDVKIAALSKAPSPKKKGEKKRQNSSLTMGCWTSMEILFVIFPPCFSRYINCFRKAWNRTGPRSVKKLSSEVNLSLWLVLYWFHLMRKESWFM